MPNPASPAFPPAPTAEDARLIAEALGGSAPALEQLLRHHYGFIYNVAVRFVLSPEDAQDLTQEVVVKVITKLAQFRAGADFRTWLYRIVFHHFLNGQRRKMEQVVGAFDEYGAQLDGLPLVELTTEEEDRLREQVEEARIGCLTGMLLCLSREQRLAYILGEIFEVDGTTAAAVLGLTPDNFRQRLARARADLYQFLHGRCGLVNPRNPCRCPKKTKGFIAAGWVNEQRLQFYDGVVRRTENAAAEKADACDVLLETTYAPLFRDHPLYAKNQMAELVGRLTQDHQVMRLFDL